MRPGAVTALCFLKKEQQTRQRVVLKPRTEEKTEDRPCCPCAALSERPIHPSAIHPFHILRHVDFVPPPQTSSFTAEGRHEAVGSECAFIINSMDFTYI